MAQKVAGDVEVVAVDMDVPPEQVVDQMVAWLQQDQTLQVLQSTAWKPKVVMLQIGRAPRTLQRKQTKTGRTPRTF